MNNCNLLASILLCCGTFLCIAESPKPAEKPANHGQPEGVQDLKAATQPRTSS